MKTVLLAVLLAAVTGCTQEVTKVEQAQAPVDSAPAPQVPTTDSDAGNSGSTPAPTTTDAGPSCGTPDTMCSGANEGLLCGDNGDNTKCGDTCKAAYAGACVLQTGMPQYMVGVKAGCTGQPWWLTLGGAPEFRATGLQGCVPVTLTPAKAATSPYPAGDYICCQTS